MSVATPLIRFGDFEVDTRSGEVRRRGSKVNLQDQPFRALMLFLERPGFFRMFVFVVTSESLPRPSAPLRFETISSAFLGMDRDVPRRFETVEAAGYRCYALVYEYQRNAGGSELITPGRLLAKQNLERAGLVPALAFLVSR